MRKNRNIALGFYQEASTANAVVSELKRRKFSRFATIHHKRDRSFVINRYFPISALFALLIAMLALFFLFVVKNTSLSALLGAIFVISGIYLFRRFDGFISAEIVDRYKKFVIIDEILIVVDTDKSDVRDLLAILRQVKSGHPLTFLLRPALYENRNIEIPLEPMTFEQLEEDAAILANSLQEVSAYGGDSRLLLARFLKSNQLLHLLRQDIADAEFLEQTIPSSAEWLLDNMYVLEGSIEDVKRNLPKKYYKELPKITKGSLVGLPRIYAIAVEFVKNTAGRLHQENITKFLMSYQREHPLTIGELWVFPLMLRLRLVEWIEFLAIHVDNRMREGELASFWGNRLLYAARYDPRLLDSLFEELSMEEMSLSGHFAEELLDHLFDESAVLLRVKKWIEERFNTPFADILHQEHLAETAEQIIFSNSIKSLIALSQLSWSDIFESVSPVDAILRGDAENIYAKMDFATRNAYREVVEEIARRIHKPEVEVAKNVLLLSAKGTAEFDKHVGYYLVDIGRMALERLVGFTPSPYQSILRWVYNHSSVLYLGGIALIIVILEATAFSILLKTDSSYLQIIAFLALAALPISEVSVQLMNFILAMVLPTRLRPKMFYKEGIPNECKTLVVVPTILSNVDSIKEDIERLEIRYLSNADPQLSFGLFTDFPDAGVIEDKEDDLHMAAAVLGIQSLENKYGSGKFFLFHRKRVWSQSENCWIGWERKRGKLDYLNRFLIGESLPENIVYFGKAEALTGIRYVITLDADTQLPKDSAKAMIEVSSHPLNRPYLSPDQRRVERGYTIIQPRVGTDFVQAKDSWFCKIFSEPTAVDPYTQAISNVYQDLVGEGSYHGKGIYDVRAFHRLLTNRFPEEHLLSHDLIEGAFSRVGFASNVCLFDAFPKTYFSWAEREHRWMRGDWQIIDWLMKTVPAEKGNKERNSLNWINRWKIFDNLRRALLPIAELLLLIAAWTVSPIPGKWTFFVLVVLILPCISLCSRKLFSHSFAGIKAWLFELKILFLRTLITSALLPLVAYLSFDALFRVLFRRLVSRRNLLQWTASNHVSKLQANSFLPFIGSCFLGAGLLFVLGAKAEAIPFCFLWIASPLIVYFIDKPLDKAPTYKISEEERKALLQIARKTWRYFDELVGPKTHWLPPDNYQTALNIEVAQRTSPTNIGMWLLAVLSAYDLRYISCDTLVDKMLATMQELKKLERYEGNFLNWYNIATLEPLFPRYVSTVDSGNLLACFWTIRQGLIEMAEAPILPSDINYEEEQKGWDLIIPRYFLWRETLRVMPLEKLQSIHPDARLFRDKALSWQPSLESLSSSATLPELTNLIEASQQKELTSDIQAWGKKLRESLATAQWLAGEKFGQVRELIQIIDKFSVDMNLKFLYSSERKLFAIGYNVDERRLDSSYYDLLASEARIASLVAIAKEDAPLEHWWSLGRLYSIAEGKRVLLSWGGTMFEYLMPLLFTKQYADSLLGEATTAAVMAQIAYGKKRDIPWGISESAFSAIDAHKIYQYKSFGIPGLGIKRGLEEDLVVSPYSTALALAIDPKSAIANLKKMEADSSLHFTGDYGFYDSVDFTRQRSQSGERGVTAYVYMAHHQGMILTAINNFLNDEPIVNRFQGDPRISGVTSLLYERIPFSPPLKGVSLRKQPFLRRLEPFSQSPILGVVETPESVAPKIILLSNQKYSLMISNAGGGYSRFQDIDIYRWRADTTQDLFGSYCYIKDKQSWEIWSSTYQPTQTNSKEYSVKFKADKAEFRRKDHQIETITEIVVSPEDDAEIRLITLLNHSQTIRHLELTSYQELALAPHLTDRSHPCFNKLFIETEAVPEHAALIGFRRKRSPEDPSLFAVHVLSISADQEGDLQYETDRAKFIGRGKSLQRPHALEGNLSNTAGTVLDPIFSLRRSFAIEPGKRVQLSFVTAISDSRDMAFAYIEKYKDITASHRAIELSWTYAQLELRFLRIHEEELQLFQKLASRLIYPQGQLRAIEERLSKNRLGQPGLWAQGISGDLPIVVVSALDVYDIDLVKQLLVAHTFLRLRGLKVDLVILDEEEAGYSQPLKEELTTLIQGHAPLALIDQPGGVFLKSSNLIPEDQLNLILVAARALFIASRGSLRQQLVSPKQRGIQSPMLRKNDRIKDQPSSPLPFLELPYFNGLGGYSPDGKEYVIYLGPNTNTPLPWINVIANEHFGTLVSEAGLGCTWYGNSQTNRLTPWSNDPLLNPIGDAIYIRDGELGNVWTPTPAPIREMDAYRIIHGQGYSQFEHNSHGIRQELLVFVPTDDSGGLPLRIQRLRLTNESSKERHLTVTAYSEWVLGSDKEATQMNVITQWDAESQSFFAYNRFNPDFGSYVAFSFSASPVTSYTADRTEFLGRNRSAASPEALSRKALSGHFGAALDPCSALSCSLKIEPGKESETLFIMGYAKDETSARALIVKYRNREAVDSLLGETKAWWNKTLTTIQVEIPDLATTFLMNRWLVYQDLSCRFWGRTGFYQSSGAYGFRDQLQDMMAIVYFIPQIARDYILKAASRQYLEGDVQHWWHPQSGAGVRTRCSDDLLWLPYVTAHYVRTTGDLSILDEKVAFLEGEALTLDQEEFFQVPTVSMEKESLLEHCLRAIKKGATAGSNGLPLIGSGDWNDGMNKVGIKGKGESVWLGWFLAKVMVDFADLLKDPANGFKAQAKRLIALIEATAWDGAWYRRAYFDDGTPIGSKENSEALIDSITQSWAVITGLANPERCAAALKSCEDYLIDRKNNLVRLLTPPFDTMTHNPGYIKGYPPGVRENGGQYTHAAAWLAMAYARMGNGNKAVELLQMISPTSHTKTPDACALYRVEPYVIAADIYDLKNQVGRGGWSWYTGSASWVYRVWLEEILGFTLRGDKLSINCTIPKEWDGFTIHYQYKASSYTLIVKNPQHISRGNPSIVLDGKLLINPEILLVDDGARHSAEITLLPQ